MNVARKVSPENGSLHSNSFSASSCAKLERTKMLFLFSEAGDSLFILLFSIFFSWNLQHYLSLDDLTNVSKFPKEALEGSPLQSTQNNLTSCFSQRKSMRVF